MAEETEIQAKMAWRENRVGELDSVVRGLGDELATVRREVAELRAAGTTPSNAQEAGHRG